MGDDRIDGAGEVLPAYAGMIRMGREREEMERCAPRVCGDDPPEMRVERENHQCSPRMRG